MIIVWEDRPTRMRPESYKAAHCTTFALQPVKTRCVLLNIGSVQGLKPCFVVQQLPLQINNTNYVKYKQWWKWKETEIEDIEELNRNVLHLIRVRVAEMWFRGRRKSRHHFSNKIGTGSLRLYSLLLNLYITKLEVGKEGGLGRGWDVRILRGHSSLKRF